MTELERLTDLVQELVTVTRIGFESAHALIGDVRAELRGDIAQLANLAGAGLQPIDKRFDDVDTRFSKIDEDLDEILKTLKSMKETSE